MNGSASYGIGYATGGKFSQSLYAFDIASGATTRFAAGESPSLAVAAGTILVADDDGECLLDASGNPLMRLDRLASRNQSAILSPSDDRILAILMFRLPFRYGGRLVILDTRAPETRHILEDGVGDRIDWTTRGSVNPGSHTLDNP